MTRKSVQGNKSLNKNTSAVESNAKKLYIGKCIWTFICVDIALVLFLVSNIWLWRHVSTCFLTQKWKLSKHELLPSTIEQWNLFFEIKCDSGRMLYGIVVQVLNELMTNPEDLFYNSIHISLHNESKKNSKTELLSLLR